MITVIADDFTGAAEIAGIGLHYGIKTTLVTSTAPQSDAEYELRVIATNMRAMEESAIKNLLADLCSMVSDSESIFIKLDSVLRGPIKAILQQMMNVTKLSKALLIPANPALGRTIDNGIYFIHGRELKPCEFFVAETQENLSSDVISLIGKNTSEAIYSIGVNDPIKKGISIGNVTSEEEMLQWTHRLNPTIVAAGGSSFFKALMSKHRRKNTTFREHFNLGDKRLFVCGSYHPYSKNAIKNAVLNGTKLRLITESMLDNSITSENLKEWLSAICQDIKIHGTVILAVANLEGFYLKRLSQRIEHCFAELVFRILKQVPVNELVIEGGATSFAVMDRLGYDQFKPLFQLAPGVIRMSPLENKDIKIIVKPGSYTWPHSIWRNNKAKK